jgi:hypothetical protein
MPEVAGIFPPGGASYSPGGFLLGTSIKEKASQNFGFAGRNISTRR